MQKSKGLKWLKEKDGKKHRFLFDKKTGIMQTGFRYIFGKNMTAFFHKKTGEMLTGKQPQLRKRRPRLKSLKI